MGASVDYLHRHTTTGRLSFRRAYPPELRRHIPGQPVQLKRSLAAKVITAPGALDRFWAAAKEFDEITAKARKAATGTYDRPDRATLTYLAALYGHGLHAGSEAAVNEGSAEANLGYWEEFGAEFRQWRVERDVEAVVAHFGPAARRLLENHGLLLDPSDTDTLGDLCLELNAATITAAEDARRRLTGHTVPLPPEPLKAPGGPPDAHRVPRGVTFPEVVKLVLESPVHSISETTKETSRTALRYLVEAFGSDLVAADINRKRVTDWLNLLVRKPRTPAAAHRRLKLPELVEEYADQDVPRLSAKTVEQYVAAMSARWRQAVMDGLIGEGVPNPFTDRKVRHGPRPERKVQYSREELQRIFGLPIFTEGEKPAGGKGAAAYWMPLILLWTGARPEEIAQLLVTDITQDPDTGRWFVRITDEGTHPHKGQRLLKTSKTLSGRRTFPVPKALLDLRFIEYVDHVRSSGERALFPQLRPKGRRNYLHAQFATWWGGHLRAAGVLAPTSQGGRKPVREFRDVWATAARASGLPREAMEYIMGHRPPRGTANEDYGDKDPLGHQIDKLVFAGLDLSAVRPWRP